MIAGEMYDPLDETLVNDRVRTRILLKELNESREDELEMRKEILN